MSTVLLLNMEQDPPEDLSGQGHVVTKNGDAAQTTFSKFGTYAFDMPIDKDSFLSVPNNADFLFGDGAFTVELWFAATGVGGSREKELINVYNFTLDERSWLIHIVDNTDLQAAWSFAGTDFTTMEYEFGAGEYLANTYYHVAFTRDDSGVFRLYWDGVKVAENSDSTAALYDSSVNLQIGEHSLGAGGTPGREIIDNVRIIKGEALYTGETLTPPGDFSLNRGNHRGFGLPFFRGARIGRPIIDIIGSLFEDTDTFNTGDVQPQNLFGSLLSDADILNHGILDAPAPGNQGIIRSTFLNSSSLFHGIVRPTNMFGSLLEDSDTLNDGEIGGSRQLEGSIFEDGDDLYHGRIILSLQDLEGSVLEDTDTLHHGAMSFGQANISGSKLGNSILVLDSVTTNSAMIESSHSINIPNGSNQTSRKLIVAVSANNSVTYTWPSGWTELLDTTTGDVSLSIAHKTIDGTEGFSGSSDTITVTTSESKIVTAISYLVNDNFADIEINTATGTSTSPNPPSVTPAGGYDNYLNIAVEAHDAGTTTTTAYPSVFLNNQAIRAGTLTTGCGIAGSHLIEPGSSIDPSAFTISQTRSWIAATISVRSQEVAYENIIYHGSMIPEIAGTILTDTDTFYHGSLYRGVRITSSQRNYRAGHENPGVYTLDNSNDWIAVTVAIR